MKRKLGIALLLMMIAINLPASMLGKLAKVGANNFVQSCTGGNMKACYEAGNNYLFANGVEMDEKKAARYYKIACDGNYYEACAQLADYYSSENKEKESARLYKLACDNGAKYSCFDAGLNYRSGTGVKKDLSKAIEYFKKDIERDQLDCNGEDKDRTVCKSIVECEYAISNKGKGHPYLDKAISLYQDECNNKVNYDSCNSLSFLYKRGWGGYKNEKLSKEYDKKAELVGAESCKNGVLGSCLNLAYVYSDKKDIKNALIYANKAQALGDGKSFEIIAKMYHEGQGVDMDKSKAKALYLKASKIFEKKCDKGDGSACESLSSLYSYGLGVVQSKKMKILFREKACANGEPFSCFLLKKKKEEEMAKIKKCTNGDIGSCKEIDPNKAKKLYKKKCDENDGESCLQYARMIKEFV
jgi:TPR repeat protein